MATELERFRDHCRKMAGAPEHEQRPSGRSWDCWEPADSGFEPRHEACAWGWQTCRCTCHDADRPQAPSEADRLLWTRLADEIDAYLTHDDAPLWEVVPE